jgi:hypothetical protein
MLSTDHVAKVIADAIDRPRREIVVPGYYRIFSWIERALPFIIDRISDWLLAALKGQSREPVRPEVTGISQMIVERHQSGWN